MRKLVVAVLAAVVLVLSTLHAPPSSAQAIPPPAPVGQAPAAAFPEAAPAGGPETAEAAITEFAIAPVEVGPYVPGQTISVAVTGGRASAIVAVGQCALEATACARPSYLTLGASGAGTLAITIHRRLAGAHGVVVDCAVEPCQLYGRIYGTSAEAEASAPIAVDPDAPVPHGSLQVTSAMPIGTPALVTLAGSGFDPLDDVQFYECSWDPPSTVVPCASLSAYASTDATGSFTATMAVSRVLLGTDCAERPSRCQIWAGSSGNLDSLWATGIEFDGSSPPTFPEVTVSPATDLVHRQAVAVQGTGFAPSSSVTIGQCTPATAASGYCPSLAYVGTGPSGAFSTTVTVARVMGEEDCAVVRCWLRVTGPPVDTVEVDLAFDASVPPPPRPTLAVDPATDLADGQAVTVTVGPLDPSSWVSVAECVIDTGQCRGLTSSVPAPPSGSVVVDVAVRRSPVTGADCAVVACELRAQLYVGGFPLVLTAPLAFDPESPPAEPAALRAVPSTGLWDRQRVAIRGERLDAADSLSARQCAGDPLIADNCGQAVWVPIAANGTIDVSFGVRRVLELPGGAQDCTVVACVIALQGQYQSYALPVTFDPAGPLVGDDLPPQLECVAWPTDGWPTGPIPAGVDASAVASLGQQMVDEQGDSVVVIHGGRLVYENYASGLDATTVFPSMSVSKTFTATMVGLLVDDGLIDIDDTSLFPEWSGPADPRAAISTRHILNMSSGLQWTESYGDPNSDVIRMIQSDDAAAFVVAKPLQGTPGTSWSYSTGDTMLLSRIIGDAAGVSGPTYEAMLHQRLFDPLGIDPVVAGFDAAGRWRAGWFTNTTTRNFAKLGLLYLRHGVWEDEQFLSTDWVDFVRAPSPGSSGYGGQVWLNGDGSFSMIGVGGQTVLVVPWLDLIVAVNNGGNAAGMADLFADAVAPTCGGTGPALGDDAATVAIDGSVLVDVLGNDSGGTAGLAPETLTVATPPAHGAAAVEAGALRYEPRSGFTGTDTLTYVVCTSDRRRCLEATVSLTVGDAPGSVRSTPAGDRRSGWLTVSGHP